MIEKIKKWFLGSDVSDMLAANKAVHKEPSFSDNEEGIVDKKQDGLVYVLLYGDDNGPNVISVTRSVDFLETYIKEHFASVQRDLAKQGLAATYKGREQNEDNYYWKVVNTAYPEQMLGAYWTTLMVVEA